MGAFSDVHFKCTGLEFFVQKQNWIQGVVSTTPLPVPVTGQENDATEADHIDLTLDDNDVFFPVVTLVTMQPISDDI